jgi:hypothetical protein
MKDKVLYEERYPNVYIVRDLVDNVYVSAFLALSDQSAFETLVEMHSSDFNPIRVVSPEFWDKTVKDLLKRYELLKMANDTEVFHVNLPMGE